MTLTWSGVSHGFITTPYEGDVVPFVIYEAEDRWQVVFHRGKTVTTMGCCWAQSQESFERSILSAFTLHY